MSASCLKTRRMISLSSGPTEITIGDERRSCLSQQTPARGARGTMESCNLESNELSMTSGSLSERRRRDGSVQKMLMLCSKLLRLQKIISAVEEMQQDGKKGLIEFVKYMWR